MWSKLGALFVLIVQSSSQVNLIDEQYLIERIPDELLNKLILHVIELLRDGLLSAKVDELHIPDFDWSLDVTNLHGLFEFREMIMFGLPDFQIQNLSASLYTRKIEIGLQLPVIGVRGSYDVHADLVGVPIWGSGAFSATFTKLQASGGIQANPSLSTLVRIDITNPSLALGELNLTLEGLLGSLNSTKLILYILAVFIGYTLLVLGVAYLVRRLRKRCKKPKDV